MYCIKCNHYVSLDANYCGFCGTAFNARDRRDLVQNKGDMEVQGKSGGMLSHTTIAHDLITGWKLHKFSELNKAIKISLVAGVMVVVMCAVYYMVSYLPKKQELATRQRCADEAKSKAIESLQKKIEVTRDYWLREEMKKMLEQGLHFKADYNSNYENCLSIHGLKK